MPRVYALSLHYNADPYSPSCFFLWNHRPTPKGVDTDRNICHIGVIVDGALLFDGDHVQPD